MAWGTAGALACQSLQTDLVKYFGKNSPQFRSLGSTSFIKWLLSPQNTSGFERIDVTSIPGKKHAVAFRIADPFCFDLCRAVVACTATTGVISQTPKEIVWDLGVNPYYICDTSNNPMSLKIDLEALEQYCTLDDNSWITDQISRLLIRFEQALDKRLLELAVTLVGKDANGVTPTPIPLWVANTTTGTSVLNPEAVFWFNQIMLNIGVDDQYAIIGGQIVNKTATFTKWTGLDAAGIDMSKAMPSQPYVFYDRNADTVLGPSDWLEMSPGAMQLVTWNRYAPGSSLRRTVTDLYSKGTITLPTTGLDIDWTWKFDPQCDVWTFTPSLYADLVAVPAGGCAPLTTANGILRLHDCSGLPIIPECPTP
jgi:hypothetical protein